MTAPSDIERLAELDRDIEECIRLLDREPEKWRNRLIQLKREKASIQDRVAQ